MTVLDIADPEHPREVSRVTFDAGQQPHWVALDPSGTRIVLNSDEQGPDHRLFIVNFDPNTGAVKLDERFRDGSSDHPGVSMDGSRGHTASTAKLSRTAQCSLADRLRPFFRTTFRPKMKTQPRSSKL